MSEIILTNWIKNNNINIQKAKELKEIFYNEQREFAKNFQTEIKNLKEVNESKIKDAEKNMRDKDFGIIMGIIERLSDNHTLNTSLFIHEIRTHLI